MDRRCSLRCYSWLIPPLKMLDFGSQFSVICANLGEKPHFSCCFDPKTNAKHVLFCLGTPLCFFLCVISTTYAPRTPRPKYAKNHPFLNDWTRSLKLGFRKCHKTHEIHHFDTSQFFWGFLVIWTSCM